MVYAKENIAWDHKCISLAKNKKACACKFKICYLTFHYFFLMWIFALRAFK